jgi:hypothetical protein
MTYHTYFETAPTVAVWRESLDWTLVTIAVCIIAFIGTNFGKVASLMRDRRRAQVAAFLLVVFVCFVAANLDDLDAARQLDADLRAGKAQTIEGAVTFFKPMPPGGHGTERFCLEETCFEYPGVGSSRGFHQTATEGGPVREGLPIRVTYIGPTIVKLEIGGR